MQHEADHGAGQEAGQVQPGGVPQAAEVPGARVRGQDTQAHPQAALRHLRAAGQAQRQQQVLTTLMIQL